MDRDVTKPGEEAIILGLLDAVAKDGTSSQRKLAAELGIALGLVNAYVKMCLEKGLLKVSEVPARRYAYYLTPRGFAEKSRLTVAFLSWKFSFFSDAREDCIATMQQIKAAGCSKIVLMGASELAEIALVCAQQSSVEAVAVVDSKTDRTRLGGLKVHNTFKSVAPGFDAIVITDLKSPEMAIKDARKKLGSAHVFIPKLLRAADVEVWGVQP